MREALDRILAAHEPYPAIVFDRRWNVVGANHPMSALAASIEIDPALLEPPVNLLRIGFHPRGFAPLLVNFAKWRAHFLERLARQIATTGDSDLEALWEEVASYPLPAGERGLIQEPCNREMLGPVRVREPSGGEWSFFGMFAGFDTPFEVTTSELALELLFPADRATAEAFVKGAP